MILVIAEFVIPILAILGLSKLMNSSGILKKDASLPLIKKKVTYKKLSVIAVSALGALLLLLYLVPDVFTSFLKPNEYSQVFSQFSSQYGEDVARSFIENIEIARRAVFKSDVLRSLLFVLLSGGLVLYFLNKQFNKHVFVGLLAVLAVSYTHLLAHETV